jgi:hypothetical protein
LAKRSTGDLANLLTPQPTRLPDEPLVNGLARRSVPSHFAKAAALIRQGSAFEPARPPPCIPGLPASFADACKERYRWTKKEQGTTQTMLQCRPIGEIDLSTHISMPCPISTF